MLLIIKVIIIKFKFKIIANFFYKLNLKTVYSNSAYFYYKDSCLFSTLLLK